VGGCVCLGLCGGVGACWLGVGCGCGGGVVVVWVLRGVWVLAGRGVLGCGVLGVCGVGGWCWAVSLPGAVLRGRAQGRRVGRLPGCLWAGLPVCGAASRGAGEETGVGRLRTAPALEGLTPGAGSGRVGGFLRGWVYPCASGGTPATRREPGGYAASASSPRLLPGLTTFVRSLTGTPM